MARGNRAASLLQDETLNAAFEGLEADNIKRWRQTKDHDRDSREHWSRMVRCLEDVKKELHRFFDSGKVAQYDLDYIVKNRKK